MVRALVFMGAVAGCAVDRVPPPTRPCATDQLDLEVAPPDGDFGDLVGDPDLWCGHPPQGGAPFSPLRVRVTGPDVFADGVDLDMSVVDNQTGEELGHTALALGLTCANVGDSAGTWVGSEAHLRYTGFALDTLGERSGTLTLTVAPRTADTPVVTRSFDVALVVD